MGRIYCEHLVPMYPDDGEFDCRECLGTTVAALALRGPWSRAWTEVALGVALGALRDLEAACGQCEGHRGAWSCHELHDARCPKARAETPEQWAGAWTCVCGAEALIAAIEEAHAILAATPEVPGGDD